MSRLGPAAALSALALCACGRAAAPAASPVPGGDPQAGAVVIASAGCGSCHMVPGVAGARGLVGPPLAGFGRRTTVAGVLPNTPAALTRWIQFPQAVIPGNAMPDMGLTPKQARDAAAYLETLT